LEVFELACLCKIESITRRDRVWNVDVYTDVSAVLKHYAKEFNRGYYATLVTSTTVIHEWLIDGHVYGQCKRGRPKKRWIDVIKGRGG